MFRPADEGRASFKFTLPENFLMQERIAKEVQHGRFLAQRGAGEIWNWESPAGKLRWARRVKLLSSPLKPGVTVPGMGRGTRSITLGRGRSGSDMGRIAYSAQLSGLCQTK